MTKRVAIAMSGGVDSSVAAALLIQQGYHVIGLHMKLYDGPVDDHRNKSCCSLDEALDARSVCARLGIPFYVIDFKDEFRETVIHYFVDEYQKGRTPNPCVMCNRNIKSRYLLEKADELDCDYLATGHYAQIQENSETGRLQLTKPKDKRKDQTYFLYGTPQEDLKRLLFPLANYIKPYVRKIAADLHLVSAAKPDSQEICFVPSNYRNFLAQEIEVAPTRGNFVTVSGEVLGEHEGLPYYTVGQRRGLGLTDATPYFVVRLDPENNRVIVGKEEHLLAQTVFLSAINWVSIDPIREPIQALIKLRYSHAGTSGIIYPEVDGRVKIELNEPQRAVTPGQAAVFYQDDILLGGGWIENAQ